MPTDLQVAPPATTTAKSFRLPTTVVPRRYELTLAPDLESFRFEGFETIEIAVQEKTDRIVLNAVDLTFDETYAERQDGTRLNGTVTIDRETELASIVFDGELGTGIWNLKISFAGELSEKLRGFYRSFHTDSKGKKHTIASTHFEPTHARRAFPCFDEPQMKATFKIFLEVDEHLTALSNARQLSETLFAIPVSKDSESNGSGEQRAKKRVEFAETMRLSTYLVAFVVGELIASQKARVNGTDICIYAVSGKEHLTDFALAAASFAVDFYESYFQIPYPGQKLDHVAIPDFPIGAMENLGLVTFRETALLVDQNQSSHAGLVRVAEIVMHEIAHMWFGDLVTPGWWNGLWLKESFATFMANVCLDAWKPHWRVWNDFALARATAAETDGLKSTHAIENPVNHPDEATEMFDVISYQKGCSVLYQLHQFVGAEIFRLGCARYLRSHQYGNSETHDLWNALETAAHEAGLTTPVRDIMEAWVFRPGHPIVSVRSGQQPGCIVLNQRMFRLGEEDDQGVIWPIPLIIRVIKESGEEEIKKVLMLKQEEIVYLGEDADSVVVNHLGASFLRVTYDDALAASVAQKLDQLTTVERFNLINDGWSALRAGLISSKQYLDIVRLFKKETDSSIWQLIYDSLDHLNALLDEDDQPGLAELIEKLTQPTMKKLGFTAQPDDPVDVRKLRALVIKLLGVVADHAQTRTKANELYEAWRQDNTSLDAELVPTVVHIAAHDGDEKLYAEFLRLSREASTPQDTIRFLYALARFRRKDLLAKTAWLSLSDEVRAQDAPYLLAALMRNPQGASETWDFVKSNFDTMKGRFPDLAMHKLVDALCVLDTPELESEVRKFFAHNKVRTGELAVRQMLEQLKINVRLRQKEKAALKAALQ